MSINISELENFLIKKLEDEVENEWSDFTFHANGPGTAERVIVLIDKWLCIKIIVNYNGRTTDPSTSRALGDPEDAHAWYAWIGLASTAPKQAKHPDELNEWAHLATYYRLTFRDEQYPGPFGFHEGRFVKDFDKSGIVELYVVTESRFQDEAPISKLELISIDLNKVKEKSQKIEK